MSLQIRKASASDAEIIRELYNFHLTKKPPREVANISKWRDFLAKYERDPSYNILIGEINGAVVSSVTLVIIENLTHSNRPYALIENVVTHADFRGLGYATALMNRACEIAESAGCYKVMLMTGSKRESTLNFYERCGFNRTDKTGFVRWFE